MNALKILVEHTGRPIEETEDVKEIRDAMIGYAEQYAKKCLEIAANEARIQINNGTGIEWASSLSYSEYNILHECFIDNKTILNIQLPSHD